MKLNDLVIDKSKLKSIHCPKGLTLKSISGKKNLNYDMKINVAGGYCCGGHPWSMGEKSFDRSRCRFFAGILSNHKFLCLFDLKKGE